MEKQSGGYVPLEEMKAVRDTPDAVFEGVKASTGWKAGKMVTEKAYDEAVAAFSAAPMDGREVGKNVQ